jgi:hypothetical protein
MFAAEEPRRGWSKRCSASNNRRMQSMALDARVRKPCCLQPSSDAAPLLRGCACRGSAGFVHADYLVDAASRIVARWLCLTKRWQRKPEAAGTAPSHSHGEREGDGPVYYCNDDKRQRRGVALACRVGMPCFELMWATCRYLGSRVCAASTDGGVPCLDYAALAAVAACERNDTDGDAVAD